MATGKELWLQQHERMMDEYLDEHPDADWAEASAATADKVTDKVRDNMAAQIDEARDRAKEGK